MKTISKRICSFNERKINNKKERLEDFNSATDKANYKETHLKINEKYFAFVRLREYPPVLNVKELLDIADISIKVLFKEEENRTGKRYLAGNLSKTAGKVQNG